MADDRALITEIKDRILERIDLSDRMTEQKLQAVADQSQRDIQGLRDQHETDKREAITRSTGEHKNTRDAVTLVGGRVSVLEKTMDEEVKPMVVWYHDEGSRLGGRVSSLEQVNVRAAADRAQAEEGQKIVAAERRGGWKAWALIGSLFATAGGLLVEYGKPILDAIMSKPHG